jgi:hypothetical protein
MDITFCTFFFDIGRQNWNTYNLANNTYLYWFENLLSLDINLYIETEEQFVDYVTKKRKIIDPTLQKTVIKVTSTEQLKSYELNNDRLNELMFAQDFTAKVHHNVPEMKQPLYNILMFNKIYTLKNAIEQNPFNTKYFSWVDAGFIRDSSWVSNNTDWPDLTRLQLKPDTIRFFCIDDNILNNLNDHEFHCMSQIRFLKGTIFFLDGNCIDELITLFSNALEECFNGRFIGSDEKIFDLCYKSKPDLFEIVKCDWRQEFHLYAKRKERDYTLILKWNKQDFDQLVSNKAEDYDFWYIGIEDAETRVIHRCDLNPVDHPQLLNFDIDSLPVSFKSFTKPVRFVMWPVDKNKKWLTRVVYKLDVV